MFGSEQAALVSGSVSYTHLKQAKTILEAGETLDKAAREGRFDKDSVYDLHLMTAKPFIYVFNVDDNELANKDLQAKLAASVAPAPAVFLNAQFEADLLSLIHI